MQSAAAPSLQVTDCPCAGTGAGLPVSNIEYEVYKITKYVSNCNEKQTLLIIFETPNVLNKESPAEAKQYNNTHSHCCYLDEQHGAPQCNQQLRGAGVGEQRGQQRQVEESSRIVDKNLPVVVLWAISLCDCVRKIEQSEL